MLGKTHMAVGVAVTLAVTRPDSLTNLLMSISVGAVGALISDIDVGTSKSHKDADRMIALTCGVAAVAIILDFIFHLELLQRIWNNSSILRIVVGVLGFVGICAFGKEQPHRSFMHSFLALLLLDIMIGLIYLPFVPYFSVGFLSHLAADIFNKRKVRLLYPKKGGFSLRLFSAKGKANSIFFLIGSAVSIAETCFFLIKIIRK